MRNRGIAIVPNAESQIRQMWNRKHAKVSANPSLRTMERIAEGLGRKLEIRFAGGLSAHVYGPPVRFAKGRQRPGPPKMPEKAADAGRATMLPADARVAPGSA